MLKITIHRWEGKPSDFTLALGVDENRTPVPIDKGRMHLPDKIVDNLNSCIFMLHKLGITHFVNDGDIKFFKREKDHAGIEHDVEQKVPDDDLKQFTQSLAEVVEGYIRNKKMSQLL